MKEEYCPATWSGCWALLDGCQALSQDASVSADAFAFFHGSGNGAAEAVEAFGFCGLLLIDLHLARMLPLLSSSGSLGQGEVEASNESCPRAEPRGGFRGQGRPVL